MTATVFVGGHPGPGSHPAPGPTQADGAQAAAIVSTTGDRTIRGRPGAGW